jgi:nucleoid DNA-binding protein
MVERDMPRRAVVSKIADTHGVPKVEAELILRTALSAIAEQIALRGRFHVAEVGSITSSKRRPRKYFNPRTREESISDGDIALKIKISKSMKSLLLDPNSVFDDETDD